MPWRGGESWLRPAPSETAEREEPHMRLELGRPVHCTDGVFGELADVVIDPTKKRLTHLVVRPHELDGRSRLVPVALAEPGDEGDSGITLRATKDELERLPQVNEHAFLRLGELPVDDPDWDVGTQDVLAMPYYESAEFGGYPAQFDPNVAVVYDRVPKGEVEIRRASAVHTADGHYLGEVDGFLVDRDDQITHFVLERGHLWGRREVTIPIGAVAKVETDVVSLRLSKDEVGELPSARVHRWL
jgi:sporulation protein YlmC with PRC-barrel domain